jgi:hypothetical protein
MPRNKSEKVEPWKFTLLDIIRDIKAAYESEGGDFSRATLWMDHLPKTSRAFQRLRILRGLHPVEQFQRSLHDHQPEGVTESTGWQADLDRLEWELKHGA